MKRKQIVVLAITLLLSLNIKAQPGNYCSLLPGPLTGHWSVPMGGFNFYFPGQGVPNTNAIGVGYACSATFPAKFNVLQQFNPVGSATTAAGSFLNRDVASASGSVFRGVGAGCDVVQIPGNITHIGGDFKASGAYNNYGVKGTAAPGTSSTALCVGGDFSTTVSNSAGNNYAVKATSANNVGTSFGVHTQATGAGTFNSYALYAINTGTASNNKWAGWFQGDVNFTASLYLASTLWITSDKRFKKDIARIEKVSDKLKKLNGYTYHFKTDEFEGKNFTSADQIGLIAQEVKEVFPQLVSEDSKGYLAVNYQGMIPVLLEAVKEQQKEIEELKTLVKATSSTNVESARIIGSVELSDAPSIILEQNVPNPFAEQTSISYSLNDGVQKAQILFYNADGKLINSSDLKTTAGKGQLNVFASDLSNGIYSYTLVIDGKIIETKRMIKNK